MRGKNNHVLLLLIYLNSRINQKERTRLCYCVQNRVLEAGAPLAEPSFAPMVTPLNLFVILLNDVVPNRLDKNLSRLFDYTVATVLTLIFFILLIRVMSTHD